MIVTVPDPGRLHAAFAAGLRRRYGTVPVAGFPRLLRVRRKQGTATGFSVVDPDGSWLRFYATGATEDDDDPQVGGLARTLEVAARQGDARGDDQAALDVLDRGLARHRDAEPVDRVRALLYRCELLLRLGRPDEARASMQEVSAATLEPVRADELADEIRHVRDLLG